MPRVLSEFLALLAPPACATCRRPLAQAGDAMCARCLVALPWLRTPLCGRCALPSPCRPCPAAAASFDSAWAPMAYAGSARDAVMALKFSGATALAEAMAAQIAANAPSSLVERGTLVPIPLSARRRRERGFNQSSLLAEALARRLGLPLGDCLRRRDRSARQLGATGLDRRSPGRLRVVVTGPIPRRVLLVDDVHTTGATLDAAARALRDAGAGHVASLTYARTLRGW